MNRLTHHNLVMKTPTEAGFCMPGEWTHHERCWMVWPMPHVQWVKLDQVEAAYANVANTISRFEPVTMIVGPGQSAHVNSLCSDNVQILELPIDDSWMRDTGPSFIKHKNSGAVAGIDWRFNCWGGAMPRYQDDAQIAHRVLNYLDMETYHSR